MVFAAPLALMLLAADPDESRGSAGTRPEQAQSMRTQTRTRFGLGGGVSFGLANHSPALGVGLSADAGAVFVDRFSVFAHLELGSIVISYIGAVGVNAEYVLNDHFSVGLGAAFSAWGPLLFGGAGFYGLTVPVRVNFDPARRSAGETRRSGLLIGLQVAPGVSLQPTEFPQLRAPVGPEAAFFASLSVGFAWW